MIYPYIMYAYYFTTGSIYNHITIRNVCPVGSVVRGSKFYRLDFQHFYFWVSWMVSPYYTAEQKYLPEFSIHFCAQPYEEPVPHRRPLLTHWSFRKEICAFDFRLEPNRTIITAAMNLIQKCIDVISILSPDSWTIYDETFMWYLPYSVS